jgi:hypothetical protein
MKQSRLKRKPRERPIEPITITTLRDLLTSRVLTKQLMMPGDAELEKLADILEGWREVFQAEQDLDVYRQLHETALITLRTLGGSIDEILKKNVSFLSAATSDSAPPTVLEILNRRLVAIHEARRLTERIPQLLDDASTGLGATGLGATGWAWLATVLPVDFTRAMRSTNPAFDPGLGHRGPLARFIAAIAPAVTGEHPTPGSVATQLKALRSRQKGK